MCLSTVAVLFVLVPASSFGIELKTNYTTITYSREEQLRIFDKRVSFKGPPYRLIRSNPGTIGNEVGNKLDAMVEKTEVILHMFPRGLRFGVKLLDKDSDVWASYKLRYGTGAHYIAFYSPQNRTVYISVEGVSVQILAHELAHVIIDQYYCTYNSCILIPAVEQEALAQFVEQKIGF